MRPFISLIDAQCAAFCKCSLFHKHLSFRSLFSELLEVRSEVRGVIKNLPFCILLKRPQNYRQALWLKAKGIKIKGKKKEFKENVQTSYVHGPAVRRLSAILYKTCAVCNKFRAKDRFWKSDSVFDVYQPNIDFIWLFMALYPCDIFT